MKRVNFVIGEINFGFNSRFHVLGFTSWIFVLSKRNDPTGLIAGLFQQKIVNC